MCTRRSFVLLMFFGVLLSIVHYSKTAAKRRFLEFRNGDKNFSITCLLFGDTGCDLECIIKSRLYEYKSRGKCAAINEQIYSCSCNKPYIHPYTTWQKKFDADYVYSRIGKTYRTAMEAEKILDELDTTGEELKVLLKPLLSPYQYSKLKLNDNSPAAKYIKNGQVDRESIQKFISDQLDGIFRSAPNLFRSLLWTDYRNDFKEALRIIRDRGTLYNFTYKVIGLGNEVLKKYLEVYLERYNIEKPELKEDEEPLLSDTIHYLIVNEFIKRNDVTNNNKS